MRVVASTAFTDADGGVAVDGTVVPAPFTVLAIGDSQTMATALEIPGGVLASLPEGTGERRREGRRRGDRLAPAEDASLRSPGSGADAGRRRRGLVERRTAHENEVP
ncbi:hypothetical protein GCM10025868_45050 [Angustibacter aerolatus]|uniref:Uncharacterized protein n=1 Tax=Angustibacter aerolatus TaxID=1162965 RepID=A0ABQ6JPS2_9ACTN|nr:hypothetical protein GCM10025868_45050 [Angustibacter aerolatus]